MRQRRTGWTGWGSFCLFFFFILVTDKSSTIIHRRKRWKTSNRSSRPTPQCNMIPCYTSYFCLEKKFKGFALVPIWVYFIALFYPVTSTQGILNNFCLSFPFYLPDVCRVLCFPPSHCDNIFSLNGIGRAVRPIYSYDCLSLLVIKSCFMLLSQTLIIWTEFLLSTWMAWAYFLGEYWRAQVSLLCDWD